MEEDCAQGDCVVEDGKLAVVVTGRYGAEFGDMYNWRTHHAVVKWVRAGCPDDAEVRALNPRTYDRMRRAKPQVVMVPFGQFYIERFEGHEVIVAACNMPTATRSGVRPVEERQDL